MRNEKRATDTHSTTGFGGDRDTAVLIASRVSETDRQREGSPVSVDRSIDPPTNPPLVLASRAIFYARSRRDASSPDIYFHPATNNTELLRPETKIFQGPPSSLPVHRISYTLAMSRSYYHPRRLSYRDENRRHSSLQLSLPASTASYPATDP